jgi:hypothetical protein
MASFTSIQQQVHQFLRRRGRSGARRQPLPGSSRPCIEQLEARLLLHANPVLDAEHLAVFGARDAVTGEVTGGLDPDSAITYKSVVKLDASGNIVNQSWFDPTAWQQVGGTNASGIPGPTDNVLITKGTQITIDGAADARTVRDDGTLRFDPTKDTVLSVDTILVEPIGTFQMGTPTQPIDPAHQAKVVFVDRESILGPNARTLWDPLQFSLGMITHGAVTIDGSTVTSFVDVPTALSSKTTTFDLGSVPTGWKAGDRLIITGNTATNSKNQNQDEEVELVSIAGSVVTIDTPLNYNHSAGSVYVADVSRNAVFESADPAVIAHRGHVMFMHNGNVQVNAAGFYGLGRTDKRTLIDDPVLQPDPDNPGQMTTDVLLKDPNPNPLPPGVGAHRVMVPVVDSNGNPVLDANGNPVLQVARTGLNARGRYAVHFHRTGTEPGDPQASISDSAVVDSPGWGIVNHSSNVAVSGNVVFNAVGAAYVTEAGDEVGSFDGNIAIHSQGSGEGIESRQQVQDFGHQGDGFWLQGGNVSLTNNVVAGQRHSGYVFFPVGLNQKGLGVTTIDAATLADPTWANGKATVADGDVPLRKFQGNVAFGTGDGFESWFSLLNVSDGRQSVIQDFKAWNTNSTGIFTPYTNRMTFENVQVTGNLANPHGTGFDRNDVTRNITYQDVNVQGFSIGINAPVNGANHIVGGTFNNIKNIYITTANSRNRSVNVDDNGPADPIQFLDNLQAKDSKGNLVPRQQWDLYLQSNFNPMLQDITRNFNPDVIRMGLVSHNGAQVFYNEQAADYTPFPSTDHADPTKFGPKAAPYIPAGLLDLTNAQIFQQYGLAIGGIVAPSDAVPQAGINGLVSPTPVSYLPDLQLLSPKYFNFTLNPYLLAYKYLDPTTNKYVTVKETTPTTLVAGWNLITRTILGQTRTLLVYGDNTPPTFTFSSSVPGVINKADIDNGSTFVVDGYIQDDSFGKKHFRAEFKLNDPTHFSAIKTRPDGSQYVTLTFTVSDYAGNTFLVTADITVTYTATLIKDLGRKNLPTIPLSVTLMELLGLVP